MNRLWENMLRTAIAGTERYPVSDADLQALGLAAAAEAEQTALRALSVARLLQQAARPLLSEPVNLPEPCAIDNRPCCNDRSIEALKIMLSTDAYAPALPEFFRLLEQTGRRLPPEAIPRVLNWAARRRQWAPGMAVAAGPTGAWLARQNPDWAELYPATEADWDTGTFAQRLHLLQTLRQNQPAEARALLAQTWATERAEHRARFLDSLRINLSAADEVFLEQAMADKSRPVRFLAYQLLLLLPDSRLRQGLALLLADVQPTDDPAHFPGQSFRETGQWSNIRLLAISPDKSASPLEAWLLLAPPDALARAAGQTPEEWIGAFFSRYADAVHLAEAVLENIAWRREPLWLRAAARYFYQQPNHALWHSPALKTLLLALPESDWRALLAALAPQHHLLELENSALVQALLESEYSWPSNLVELLAYFPLRTEQPKHWMPPKHLRLLLERAAFRCESNLAPTIQPADRQVHFIWQQAVAQFRTLLVFRQSMQRALNSG